MRRMKSSGKELSFGFLCVFNCENASTDALASILSLVKDDLNDSKPAKMNRAMICIKFNFADKDSADNMACQHKHSKNFS